MSADGDVADGGVADGALCAGEVVATVHETKGLVVAAFDAVFYCDIMVLCKGGEVVEFFVVDAVGSGADDEAGDGRVGEGFFVSLLQEVEWGVGGGVGLEVGKVVCGVAVAAGVEAYALVDLLGDGGCRAAVGGHEGFAVAESAAVVAKCAVAVGTGEATVDGYFADGGTEDSSAVVGVGEVVHFEGRGVRI